MQGRKPAVTTRQKGRYMFKLLKRLFKRKHSCVVYMGGKPRKFKSFNKAIEFMLAN